MEMLGRTLVFLGLIVVVIGIALMFAERVPFVGRLPGDVTLRGDGWTVYAPIGTSIILSLVLTAAISLYAWLAQR